MTVSTTSPVVTEEALRALVDAFYDKVRRDPLIGPIFEGAIDDWPAHLDKLHAFWSSIMLKTRRFVGRPLATHISLGEVMTPAAFERWLSLWRETTDERLSPDIAREMQEKAGRIAESLSLGIAFHRDGAAALGGGGSRRIR